MLSLRFTVLSLALIVGACNTSSLGDNTQIDVSKYKKLTEDKSLISSGLIDINSEIVSSNATLSELQNGEIAVDFK